MYSSTEFPSAHTTPDPQQPLPFQAHLSSSGLPDLNALMFPSPDPFNYNYAHPLSQQQYPKPERAQPENASSPESIFGASGSQGGPYDSLEVQLFGPLPPYLLQGQTEPVPAEGAVGVSERPNLQPLGANGNNRAMPNSIPGQSFMSGTTAGAMNLDSFFGDEYEWDDMLLQQPSFRPPQDVKEQF